MGLVGPRASVAAPSMHIMSSLKPPPHVPQFAPPIIHSATRSQTLPPMSNAPKAETQPLREPVGTAAAPAVLQVVVPSSAPPLSGVPSAASVHSWFVGSRFPAFAHAAAAWNQVRYCDGIAPGIETA